MSEATTMYDHVGGMDFFRRLVDRFYQGVESDPILRPMYPDDLEPGKEALALFLGQYWGGPTTYSESRGHPRLRMRHFPFRIAGPEREAWVRHMTAAVQAAELDPEAEQQLLDYFSTAATHMINAE
jgi:hemoglobin